MANGPVLIALLALAGVAAATLLGLALAGFARRRSASYLLVALALGTLLVRVVVASAAMGGLLTDTDHHLAEHVLDVLMAALVIAAVYTARSARRRARSDEGPEAAPDGGEAGGRPSSERCSDGGRDSAADGSRDGAADGRRGAADPDGATEVRDHE
jgi:hypothetical protein